MSPSPHMQIKKTDKEWKTERMTSERSVGGLVGVAFQ